MTRIRLIVTALFAGTAMLWAQQTNAGWRRVGDPPPAPPEPQQQTDVAPPPEPLGQDPTQPVERTPVDAWGNPQQRNDRPPAAMMQRQDPPALPAQLVIKQGTFVTVRISQGLSSDRNQAGDVFAATLAQPIVVDGVVVAQRNQPVTGRVAEAKKAGRVEGTSRLGLQLTALTLVDGNQANIQSSLVNRNGQTSVGNDVAAVGTTTAVGAAIGAAADWGRGAAIGAGAGAAAGLIGVLLTRGRPTVVYPETVLTFRIDNAIAVNTTHAPYAFQYINPQEYNYPVQTRVMQPRPGPGPYGPAPAPYYYGPSPYPYPYYYPYYGYPGYWGPGFGFGVVVRGGTWRRFH
jgi:hypothetical protein